MTRTPQILLNSPLSEIPGIGPCRADALAAAGLTVVLDLLRLKPRRYEDRTKLKSLSEIIPNSPDQGVFRAKLNSLNIKHFGMRKCLVSATFSDDRSTVAARWFNQPYLMKNLKPGCEYFIFGGAVESQGRVVLDNPELENTDQPFVPPVSDALTPVYSSNKILSTVKISQKVLRKIISHIFQYLAWDQSFPDLSEGGPLGKVKKALLDLHWPLSLPCAERARKTLSFFDQVLFQLGVFKRREKLTGKIRSTGANIMELPQIPFSLPFHLTTDQNKSLREILTDISSENSVENGPMNRLLQGEVGSGKTMVAMLAMRFFSEKYNIGEQCAFMAPTEILARQHHEVFLRLFPDLEKRTALLTGSMRLSEKREAISRMASRNYSYIFGTHALFQEDVYLPFLGFCVIDEQQRFGVEHRRALLEKGKNIKKDNHFNPNCAFSHPHLLLLTATPIPRTLSLTIFGDMEVSIIKELPPGRIPIQTSIAHSWSETLPIVKERVEKGEQGYFICPLIEKSSKIQWSSVNDTADKLRCALPGISLGCITGNQKIAQKDETMAKFHSGDVSLLIGTTLLEVGIDNPNATFMIIDDADRFGLSQLHQLRGRIGRGNKESVCILIASADTDSERLTVMSSTNDGFAISLEDLRIRGPGDLIGTRQSGLFHPAFMGLENLDTIELARRRAFDLLTLDSAVVRNWFLERMVESFGSRYETFMDGG